VLDEKVDISGNKRKIKNPRVPKLEAFVFKKRNPKGSDDFSKISFKPIGLD
tara:strand:- start:156 stop:308 length:153 start_codon:yes stop_codon:yes gene_type:complete